MEFFLCVVGMVMIIEGLPYFAFPEKMKTVIRRMLEMPENTVRSLGLGLMAAGLVVIYLARNV